MCVCVYVCVWCACVVCVCCSVCCGRAVGGVVCGVCGVWCGEAPRLLCPMVVVRFFGACQVVLSSSIINLYGITYLSIKKEIIYTY
jgi:hypothetical protein